MNTNPPMPAGWRLMTQSAVTPDMTTWAVDLLHEAQATNLAIGDARIKSFGDVRVLARVEWHPPDGNNAAVHVGVTLYESTT
jgi:hypothetical protein